MKRWLEWQGLPRRKRRRVSRKTSGQWPVVSGRCFVRANGRSPLLFFILVIILLFSACDKSGEDAYKKADELWSAGKYNEAVAQYEVISKKGTGRLVADSLYQIGNIYYLNLRDYQKAIEAYRRLVEISPGSPFSPDAQRKIADIYKDKFGDLRGAIAEYQHFAKVFPKEADKAMYQTAQCYALLKEFAKAREQYEAILKDAPDIDYKDEVYYQIANSYYLEGKTGEAKKGFEEFLGKFPESKLVPDARLGIALAYEEEGNLAEALSRLTQLKGVYHNQRALELRITGIRERIAAKKRPVSVRALKRKRK